MSGSSYHCFDGPCQVVMGVWGESSGLLKKTIAHRLPKSELKGLVNLIRNGDYRSLPDTLRTQLFKNKGMTPKLANLYLRPESLFDGEGEIC